MMTFGTMKPMRGVQWRSFMAAGPLPPSGRRSGSWAGRAGERGDDELNDDALRDLVTHLLGVRVPMAMDGPECRRLHDEPRRRLSVRKRAKASALEAVA